MKISASGLRIGNLLTVDNPKYHPQIKGEVLKVSGINECENLDRDGRSHCVSLNFLDSRKNLVIPAVSQLIMFVEPIPLTESVISKTNIHDGLAVHNDNFSGYLTLKYSISSVYELWIGSVCLKIVTYLHELQNIIFDLTDEKLQIK